jgi:formate dehydrogenase (NADP+) beta subunit
VRARLPARPCRERAGRDLSAQGVAADYKGDIKARLPRPPQQKNGKRLALVGGGPASLTVARDLAPLGYDCVVFDADPKAGGMIRTQIPRFRLPEFGD